jgi:hypothetical protein
MFSGQQYPWYIDKVISSIKYNQDNVIETIYPAYSLVDDLFKAFYNFKTKELLAVEAVETVVPFGKELTKRPSIGQAIGLEESIAEQVEAEADSKGKRPSFVEGGEVQDKYPVPFVKKDPKARVSDDLGGEPYQEQMGRLGFNEGTIFGTVEDTLKKASRVAADTVEKLKTERQEPSPEDTQRVNNFLAKHYDRFTTQYPELSDISFEQFKNSAQRLAANVRKIESDNRNVPLGGNNAGSSATGKYQFLRDSVEPAINRTLRRVEPQDKNIFDSIRENKDTSKLNDEAQQLLFFGDIFEKTGSDKHLVPYFLGDEQAGKNVYLYQHHTLSSKVPEYNQETIDRTNKLWNSPE